ncbi:HdeD family acid-resistance protein [Vulcanococcus limneticus]|uniref:HdeD family acid-resistance protein n=1 Tax=Vulcanococcus limneticus TaxID=2170428 RepID=UPI00398BF40A
MTPKTLRWITAALLFLAAAASVALPFLSATALTLSIGVIAAVAGVGQLLRLGQVEGGKARIFRGLTGIFYLAAGLWVVAYPVQSEVSLTLFVGLLLIAEGVMELAAAAASQAEARGLVLADGVITALLGGLLVAEWPTDSLWAVGTLFGISLFFTGVRLLSAPAAEA